MWSSYAALLGVFWLVTGGWLWNYRWWEPFGESQALNAPLVVRRNLLEF